MQEVIRLKNTSIGAIMKDITHFKYSPYIFMEKLFNYMMLKLTSQQIGG